MGLFVLQLSREDRDRMDRLVVATEREAEATRTAAAALTRLIAMAEAPPGIPEEEVQQLVNQVAARLKAQNDQLEGKVPMVPPTA